MSSNELAIELAVAEIGKQEQLKELERKAEDAFRQSRQGYTLALLYLHKIKTLKLYKLIDPSFRRYLKLNFGFASKSTIYKHLEILEAYLPFLKTVADSNFPDWDRLRRGYLIAPQETELIFEWAKVCSDEAFENNLKELQGKVATDECLHNETKEVTTIVCVNCGKALGQIKV